MSSACLETTVVNTSGERKYFDFLPVAGLYLEPGAEYTAPGTITDWIRRKGAGPIREKLIASMRYAFEQGWMEIKSAPTPVMFDAEAEKSYTLGVNNGALNIGDPCYVEGGGRVNVLTIPTTTTAATTTTAS